MTQQKFVSVYIVTRNRLGLLKRAVQSVLSQTYPLIEVIVVDDASTDGTPAYLDSLTINTRIVVLRNEVQSGACASRNRAIAAATGYWITGLDDDDIFSAQRVDTFVEYWENHKRATTSALYTNFVLADEAGRSTRRLPKTATVGDLKRGNCVGCQVFVRTSTLLACGQFDSGFPAWQDYETWYRIAKFAGSMENAGGCSYVVDTNHPYARISTADPARYWAAFDAFVAKHGTDFNKEEVMLLRLNVLAYPQVSFSPSFVIGAFKVSLGVGLAYAQAFVRKLLGATQRSVGIKVRLLCDQPRPQVMLAMYRLANIASKNKWGLGGFNAVWAVPTLIAYRFITEICLGYELPAATRVGQRLTIHHGYGIVINKNTRIGDDVQIRQHVTIGSKTLPDGSQSESPVIGDRVEIGAGAIIIGDVSIGDDVKIGAGAVVVRSVQSWDIVVGNPAAPVSKV